MYTLLFVFYLGLYSENPVVQARYVYHTTSSHKIYYNPSRKLTWNDFKTVPDNKNTAALTASEISYTINVIGDLVDVEVSCFFDKANSVVSKSQKKEHILNHEQRHFDITYLFAKKFIQALKSKEFMKIEEIEVLYDKTIREWTAYENQYDTETKNAVSKEQQERWNQKIEQELSQL